MRNNRSNLFGLPVSWNRRALVRLVVIAKSLERFA